MKPLLFIRNLGRKMFVDCWRTPVVESEWTLVNQEVAHHATRIRQTGLIVRALERFFFFAQFISPAGIAGIKPPHIEEIYRRNNKLENNSTIRAQKVDYYLLFWWVIIVGIFIFFVFCGLDNQQFVRTIAYVLVFIRLFDLLITSVNQNVFNYFRYDDPKTSSALRNLVIVFINFFELSVLFAILYLLNSEGIQDSHGKAIAGARTLYFSFITQTTVGYGDYAPVYRLVKCFVGIQLTFSFFFTAVIIGRLLPSLVPVHDSYQDGPRFKQDTNKADLVSQIIDLAEKLKAEEKGDG